VGLARPATQPACLAEGRGSQISLVPESHSAHRLISRPSLRFKISLSSHQLLIYNFVMGTWGTAIFSNDTSSDIKADFFDKYDDGTDVNKISTAIQEAYEEDFNDVRSEDYTNCWFALAWCQWSIGHADKFTGNKISEIINTNQDDTIWRELGGTEKDIFNRRTVVNKLQKLMSIPKAKPRTRLKKVYYLPDYHVGDCAVFKTKNKKYIGIVIVAF
jgi:hypothetical protein